MTCSWINFVYKEQVYHFFKFRLTISVYCLTLCLLCHSSIISSNFWDYSWVRLGLGVEKWSRFNFWINILFQGQQYVDPGTHLTRQNQDA